MQVEETMAFEKRLPIIERSEVLVAGGGLAGVCAAVCAARSGLGTMLIESFGSLGGIATSGLLGAVSGFDFSGESVVRGVGIEVISRAKAINGVTFACGQAVFDPEKLKSVLLEMLEESGVKLFLYTQAVDVSKKEDKITHAVIWNKDGLSAVSSKLFIDATGDADICYLAGCPCRKGRPQDGRMQSATLVFSVAGIDRSTAPSGERLNELWGTSELQSIVPINHVVVNWLPRPGEFAEITVNMSHLIIFDGTCNADLTRAQINGRKQSAAILEFFRSKVPGFENAYISHTACQVGVRETRRIVGDYILTEQDLLQSRGFPDEIARCCWPIDIHNPTGTHTEEFYRGLPGSFGIPYRCLIPRGIANLLVAGRPISVDHVAHSSTRIQATCMAVGQAAGTAAKFALESGSTRSFNVQDLRDELLKQGAVINRIPEHDAQTISCGC